MSLVAGAQNAWINEFHYDDIGTDTLEFLEVVIENPSNYSLSLFSVVLYNGSSSMLSPYDTKTLNVFTPGASTGNFTLYKYNYPKDGIQNGPPDGMALVYNGTVIAGQFLSYEGTFTALTGVAAGMTSVDIGVSESGTTPEGYSLQLSGSGSVYSDFTWQPESASTPGALNTGQTITTAGLDDPENFNSTTISATQIDLNWELNASADSILIASNLSNSFGTPSGVYAVGATVEGGGTVIYKGKGIFASHTGLSANTVYYYKAWSKTSGHVYSAGISDSSSTQSLEPTDHPSGLIAVSNGPTHINVSWNDSDGDRYLVKGSSAGYGNIVAPIDGVAQADSLLVKNVDAAVQTHQFTSLIPSTTYYFKIYPYKGTGNASMYKTDGTVPQASATTGLLDIDLFISEVADPRDSTLAKFVEIYNSGTSAINFNTTPVYLCRQSNGGSMSSVRLTGSISPGSTHVTGYVLSTADTLRFFRAFGFIPNQYSGYVSGNGNDGYFLYYGGPHTSGYLFDSYGVMNQDGTGKAWEYTDKKAIRKRSVLAPNTTWTAAEWVIPSAFSYAKDMTPGYHRGDNTWQGNVSSNWNAKGSNWNSPYGFIPDASSNVIIPNTAIDPIITEPSSCNQVMMQTGSSLSIQSSGSLQVLGQ
jgi:hypothetical protein